MDINKQEIDSFVMNTIRDNKLRKINNIYLSTRQINVLDKYNIDYKNVLDIKGLIFVVEDYINENFSYEELSDLEDLSRELSEFNYYYNTNK